MGPLRGPASAVRILRDGPQLPDMQHGSLPGRSFRRRTAKGRVRGRCRHHRGQKPGAHGGRGRRRALRPWTRSGGSHGGCGRRRGPGLLHQGRSQTQGRRRRLRHRNRGQNRAANRRRAGRRHAGGLRHAQKIRPIGQKSAESQAGTLEKGRRHAPGDRPGDLPK